MKKYEVQIRKEVKNDIEEIKDFIVEKTSKENAERYAAELRENNYFAEKAFQLIKILLLRRFL